jgi:hypothetical protein
LGNPRFLRHVVCSFRGILMHTTPPEEFEPGTPGVLKPGRLDSAHPHGTGALTPILDRNSFPPSLPILG